MGLSIKSSRARRSGFVAGIVTAVFAIALQPILASGLVGAVVINELMPNPVNVSNSDSYGEWVELHNPSSEVRDVSNWTLGDGENTYAFPNSYSLAAGQYYVVCSNIDDTDATCDAEWPNMALANSGEVLTLKNSAGDTIDVYEYVASQASNTTEGQSLEIVREDNTQTTAKNASSNYGPNGNTGTPGAMNTDQANSPVMNQDTGEGFTTIQGAIDDAETLDGHTIYIKNGTYDENPDVTKSLTIEGESEAGVVIVADNGGYGFENSVDGLTLTLKNFTLTDSGHYGFKLTASDATLEKITARNSDRTEIDFNGMSSVTLRDVTADGNDTGGNGISFSNSNNIDLDGAKTMGNQWGGVALYPNGPYYTPGSNSAKIYNLRASEPNELYQQVAPGGTPVGVLDAPQYRFAVTNDEFRPDAEQFTFYQRNFANASDFALGLHTPPAPFDSFVNTDSAIHRISNGLRMVPTNGLTITAAIQDTPAGGTIKLMAGEHDEDDAQLVIDKNLTIRGSGTDTTTVRPQYSTGSGGDARGWFLVQSGAVFNLSAVTLDGVGQDVHQAIRHKGSGNITSVAFKNITYPNYAGLAVVAFGDGKTNVRNSTFNNIGRVGVLYYGAAVAGSNFSGNTYTGKGDGDWIDYALDISAGAVVRVTNNTITNNSGVASSDGSSSAGILVTTYLGSGTEARINNNIITGNTTGVFVGYDNADTSKVIARGNTITGNDWGAYSTNELADFRSNWWGDNSGPTDTESGDGSMPDTNPGGTGDAASKNIWYENWTTVDDQAPTMENINLFVNGVNTDIARPGDTLRVVADVVDESDVDRVQIWVRDYPYTGRQITSGEMSLVSGNTYEFVFVLPDTYSNGDPLNETDMGNYYNFRPYDVVGNSTIGFRNNFTVDNTAPAQVLGMTISQNADVVGCGGAVNERRITVSWDASSDANLKHYEYQADRDAAAPYEFTTTVTGTSRTGDIRDEDGTYNYRVRAIDQAGNQGAWSDWCSVTLDRTAPLVTIIQPDKDTLLVPGPITVQGTIDDLSVATVSVELNGVTQSAPVQNTGTWQTTFSGVPFGIFNILATAEDAAGNRSESSMDMTVTNVPPQIIPPAPAGDGGAPANQDDEVLGVSTDGSNGNSASGNSLTPFTGLLPGAALFAQTGIGPEGESVGLNSPDSDDELDVEVLGEDSDQSTEGTLEDDVVVEDGCASLLGLCWYWWVVGSVVVVGVLGAIAVRRTGDDA